MGSQGYPPREEAWVQSLNHEKEPDMRESERGNSQAKVTARTKDPRLREKHRRSVVTTWVVF